MHLPSFDRRCPCLGHNCPCPAWVSKAPAACHRHACAGCGNEWISVCACSSNMESILMQRIQCIDNMQGPHLAACTAHVQPALDWPLSRSPFHDLAYQLRTDLAAFSHLTAPSNQIDLPTACGSCVGTATGTSGLQLLCLMVGQGNSRNETPLFTCSGAYHPAQTDTP